MALTTRIKTIVAVSLSAGADYQGQIRDDFPDLDITWGDGTVINTADVFVYDERTLGATTNEDLDLTAMANGPNGTTVDFSGGVKLFAIHFPSTNPGDFEIKPGSATGWLALFKDATDTLTYPPGTTAFLIINANDGDYPVTGSSKLINFNNTAGSSGTYKLLAVGASA